MFYTNPILPGFYPDPSICRVGRDYYLVTSSFEYFPGVLVFHSCDLVHWRQIGHCLTRKSQLPLDGCPASGGIWAPTIRYHQGTFYMTTTNTSGGGHFYVTAQNPASEWSEPVWVAGGGWDASLFFDDDGKVYFQWYVYPDGIFQAEIDITTGKHHTAPRVVWQGTGGRSPEGPHLYKIDGRYYLMAAEGGTEEGHMVTISRSTNIWGPWESYLDNPILTQRSIDHPIQTTGHGDLVQTPKGNWWMVFLGTRPVGYPRYHILGRETFLAPVKWEDGWPVVGNNGRVAIQMEAPLPAAQPMAEAEPLRDDFEAETLGFCWNWLRNPSVEDYWLTSRPGWLRLIGSEHNLDDETSPTFLGRRQRFFECRVSTKLNFNPWAENEEAGLVALGDNRHHYEIGIARRDGERTVLVRRRIGTLQAVVAQQSIPDGEVTLYCQADMAWYTFGYALEDGPLTTMARGETRYLCTEAGAAKFTGVYFGMYATGNGVACEAPADFDWFEIDVLSGDQ
jgi:xylan 1,4-beta-xylosidase